jgi:hypothetical protein
VVDNSDGTWEDFVLPTLNVQDGPREIVQLLAWMVSSYFSPVRMKALSLLLRSEPPNKSCLMGFEGCLAELGLVLFSAATTRTLPRNFEVSRFRPNRLFRIRTCSL